MSANPFNPKTVEFALFESFATWTPAEHDLQRSWAAYRVYDECRSSSIDHLLEQATWWRDGEGGMHLIRTMDVDHAGSLVKWLTRHWPSIHRAIANEMWKFSAFVNGEMAALDMERAADEWEEATLEDRPLFAAVVHRAKQIDVAPEEVAMPTIDELALVEPKEDLFT